MKLKQVKLNIEQTKLVTYMCQSVKFLSTMQNLLKNLQVLLDTLVKVKPAAAKGQYMRNITVSTTMGPAVTVNTNIQS